MLVYHRTDKKKLNDVCLFVLDAHPVDWLVARRRSLGAARPVGEGRRAVNVVEVK